MKIILKYSLQYAAIFFSLIGVGQNLPNDASRNLNGAIPNPNSSAVSPQKPFNVDLYSGRLNAGFDLYTYSNSSTGLRHSISLNYSGGGIRVDDIASNVGLGWNINFGGIINRVINSLPDEVPYAGFINATDTAWKAIYSLNSDGEIDSYSYVAGNNSGQFVIGKNNQILSIPKSNVKIERNVVSIGNMNVACPNINFKITDESGTQYLYQTYNCSKVSSRDFYASSSWFLTQIISAFNTDTIFFNYTPKTMNYVSGKSHVKYFESTTSSSQISHNDIVTNSSNEMILSSIKYPDKTIVTFNYDVFKRLDFRADSAIANINISNSGTSYGYVFNYGYFGPLLSGLSGTNNDITYQNYNSITDPNIAQEKYRLKLKGFQKYSGTVSNVIKGHQFTYDNTELIPRGSDYGIDNWGYQSLVVGHFYDGDRPAKLEGSQAASLKSIILPTGGSLKFDYELHTTTSSVHPNKINTLVSNIYNTQTITNFTHPVADEDLSSVIAMPAGIGVSTIYNKINIVPNNVSRGPLACWQAGVPTKIYVKLLKLVGSTYSQIASLDFNISELSNFTVKSFEFTSVQTDQFKLQYDLGYETACTFQTPSYYIHADWNTYKEYIKVNIGEVGGIRVKRVTQYDGLDTTKNVINDYLYEYINRTPSGVLANYPIFKFPYFECYKASGGNVIYNNWGHPVVSPSGSFLTSPVVNASYNFTVTTDNAVNRVYAPGGAIVGYAFVQAIDGTSASNTGKTISEFTTFNDYAFLTNTQANVHPFNPQSIADYKYGLPIKTTIYDANNVKVKKIENTFLTLSSLYNITDFRSRKIMLQTTACGVADEYGLHAGDILQCRRYYPITGKSLLVSSKETEYYQNGDSLITITDIDYDTTYCVPINTKIINSKGEQLATKTYYPFNYTIAGEISSLKNANIKCLPIVSETWKGTLTPVLLNAKAVTFQTTSTGQVKMLGSYNLKNTTPISQAAWGTFSPNQILQQPSLYNLQSTVVSYDSKGNLTEINDNGTSLSRIYGYYKSRPIAEAVNATASETGFTSFESDDKLSWTIGAASTYTSSAHTGNIGLRVAPNTSGIVRNFSPNVSSGSQNKKYVFSCWVKTDASYGAGNGRLNIYTTYNLPNSTTVYPNVSGAFKTTSFGNTSGKWVYYEVIIDLEQIHTISGDNNPFQVRAYIENVDATKYFIIDDVRFYPLDAQMKTYTYNPLFGLTSETNPNNEMTTYEYDVFGRQKLVRDLNGNILLKNEYNYR